MTRHMFNAVTPPWYMVDRFADHFERIFGSDWTTHEVKVDNFEFRTKKGKRLPMTPSIRKVTLTCGTIYASIQEALREDVPRVWLQADVLIAES